MRHILKEKLSYVVVDGFAVVLVHPFFQDFVVAVVAEAMHVVRLSQVTEK
jgi:hypothetical protein